MKIGYARVSTEEQNLEPQFEALRRAGCDRIFSDQLSGARAARPGLAEAIDALGDGDMLVVWRLDRLARSLRNLLNLVEEIAARGAGLHSLSESIQTDSAAGRLMLHVLAALGEFERGLISERTKAGLVIARANGSRLGRERRLTPEQVEYVARANREGRPMTALAEELGVDRSTLYRNLPRAGAGLRD